MKSLIAIAIAIPQVITLAQADTSPQTTLPSVEINAPSSDQEPLNSQLKEMADENRDAINMQQVYMNTQYPHLSKTVYKNGLLTLKPSWPEGNYSYNRDGQTYTASARDLSIQLFNPQQQHKATEQVTQEIAHLTEQLNLTASIYDSLSHQVEKQARAISVNAALSAIPSDYRPEKSFIGIGFGYFDKHSAIAVGISRRFDSGVIIQGRYGSSEGTSVVSAGAGISF